MRSCAWIAIAGAVAFAAPVMARDLPRDVSSRKATGCEWAGPGFTKVEGSETCVRVGGSVRAEYGATTGRGSAFSDSLGR